MGSFLIKLISFIKMESPDYSFEIKILGTSEILWATFLFITEGTKKYKQNKCIFFLSLIC